MAKVKCAFCGYPTKVRPMDAKKTSQLVRTPHAPTKLGFKTFPPLCEDRRWGRTAKVQATLYMASCDTCIEEGEQDEQATQEHLVSQSA